MNKITNTNIFLIGMMGSGKSTVGCLLAKKLSLKFVDLDQEIEKGQGLAITDIFNNKDQEQFRQLEQKYLKEISSHTGQVIATGGGIILTPGNRQLLKSNGIVILLRCQMNTLSGRLKDIRGRPLLNNNDSTARTLNIIWLERQEFYYSTAQIIVDNDFVNPATVITPIIEQIKGAHGNNQS